MKCRKLGSILPLKHNFPGTIICKCQGVKVRSFADFPVTPDGSSCGKATAKFQKNQYSFTVYQIRGKWLQTMQFRSAGENSTFIASAKAAMPMDAVLLSIKILYFFIACLNIIL